MYETLTFIMLDSRHGDHAPVLIALSDGLQEELRITIAGAKVGNMGGNLSDFEETDKTTKQALRGRLAKTRPREVNEHQFYEILFHDYIMYQIRN